MSLIGSLQALPPKQALALALAEKAKREVAKRKRQELLLTEVASASADVFPGIKETPSLILNRNHPLSALYYEQARYKVFWGGRGSAKSWGFAEAAVRIAAERPVFFVCAREHQNSIRNSVHRLLKKTIKRLGLESWFTVTDREIRSKAGAQFVFVGLWQNEEDLRSLEGADYIWIEEAHAVSETSWRSLLPTIRTKGSEVWISMNFVSEDNATFQRFVGELHEGRLANPPRTDSIVIKINYDQNPYFGESELQQEMEDDKRQDEDLYEHIWLGLPLKHNEAIIYSRKYESLAFPDDLWKKAPLGLRFGLDFGFANDPLSCLRMFMLDDCLYISHEVYGTGIELREMAEAFDTGLPDVRNWPMFADCSRPETISDLTNQGFRCRGAEKWQGCVEDGVTHIRKFKKIYVHPRCVQTLREFRLYTFKIDPKTINPVTKLPEVLPIIVDKHNHSMDAMRYGLDGHIQRGGALGIWARLGKPAS